MHSSKVKCGKKLKCLTPVLNKCIRLNRAYSEKIQWEDCAWWANERASVGILAAAAWLAGGVALEEYSTRKVKGKKQGAGRCDLFFTTVKNKFACEAKQVFPRFEKGRTADFSKLKERFDSACEDTKKLSKNEGPRLGICFVTPRFGRSRIKGMDKSLKDFLNRIQNELEFDAIAWCFPKEARKMEWEPNNKTYPGIIILIRKVS